MESQGNSNFWKRRAEDKVCREEYRKVSTTTSVIVPKKPPNNYALDVPGKMANSLVELVQEYKRRQLHKYKNCWKEWKGSVNTMWRRWDQLFNFIKDNSTGNTPDQVYGSMLQTACRYDGLKKKKK